MKNTIKVLGIVALIAVIGFSFAACDTGGGSGGGGGSGELWAKLTAGSGTWKDDNNSFTTTFTKIKEDEGACELSATGISQKVYVKLNSSTGIWYGNLPASKNISFGGGSSNTGVVTFSSDTHMTISGTNTSYDGSYTRQ